MASGCENFLPKVHISFFKRCLQVLPPRYASLDTTRMTVAFFALSGLDMLNAVHVISKEKKEIIDWIYSLQIIPDEQESNLGVCGFRGSTTIGSSSSIELNKYDSGHIAMTYTALLSLLILDDDLSRVNKHGVICGLKKLQLTDGSFCPTPDGSENDMRFVYCACCISYILDDWSGINLEKLLSFIKKSLSYEGAFGQGPGLEAHGGSTFCAVASLVLMDRLHDTLSEAEIEKLKRWCILRQQSGFQGRPNKPVDTCYSFWVGATLKLLGAFEMCNFEANKCFLMETQDTMIGGFAKCPDNSPDTLHAYFGVCGLSLMGEPEVSEMHAALNISTKAADRLATIQRQWKSNSIATNNCDESSVIKNINGTVSHNGHGNFTESEHILQNSGQTNVPNLQTDQHITFLKSSLKSLHNPHAPFDNSRLTAVFHAVLSLDVLGGFSSLTHDTKQNVIQWIYNLQILPVLGSTQSPSFPIKTQIELTYKCIYTLLTLEDNLNTLDKDTVITQLRDLKQSDCTTEKNNIGPNDVRSLHCAICLSYVLQDFTALKVPKLVQYLKSFLFTNGVLSITNESQESVVYWVVSSLALLDNLQSCFSKSEQQQLLKWCQSKINNVSVDRSDYTETLFYLVSSLKILGSQEDVLSETIRRSILMSQHDGLGGFTKKEKPEIPDIHQTYYSLNTLAIYGNNALHQVDVKLGLSNTALKNVNKLWVNSGGQTAF